MNYIEILVKWRFDNLEKELNINFNSLLYIDKIHERAQQKKIQKNLLLLKYITSKRTKDQWYYYSEDVWYYVVIKNIIWKNIINYEIKYDAYFNNTYLHSHMLYNNFTIKESIITNSMFLHYKLLLNHIGQSTMSQNNLDIMQSKIITYLILIDQIITRNLIVDLVVRIQWYMFDLILMV